MGKLAKERSDTNSDSCLKHSKPTRTCKKTATRATISTLPAAKDEHLLDNQSAKRNETIEGTPSNNQIKSEYMEEEHSDEEEEYVPSMKKDDSSDSSVHSDQPSYKITIMYDPILQAETYSYVSEIDFRIFLDSVSRTKVYSVMLVDKFGRIIFSDKLGHELFEGSLNNFRTLKIQNLLLKTIKASTLEELKGTKVFTQNSIFNWIIYSKNTKRRYSRVPFSNSKNSFDTFFRFLKVLSIRFRPVCVDIDDFTHIEGFWNQRLAYNELRECFLLEAKLCSTLPDIQPSALWNDPLLNKYIQINSKKAEAWANDPRPERRVVEKQSDESDFSLFSDRMKPQKKGKKKLQLARNSTKKQEEKSQHKESNGVRLFTQVFIDDI